LTQLYVSMGFFPEEYFNKTVSYICEVQQADGAIPWQAGAAMDPWDHVESAMGLTIGGYFDEAKQAYYWMRDNQLADGSWLAAYKDGEVEDGTRAESNFVAYIATGVWHYYLVSGDLAFLERLWPTVSRAIAFVLTLRGDMGQIYWARDTREGIKEDSLVTGCSSIYKSLECAIHIANTLQMNADHWIAARHQLGQALRNHPECFDRTWDSKSRYAMDWFYPVLTGVIKGSEAVQHLASRWHHFVVQDMGCRCVDDEPWVTVAESCELVMALLAAGNYPRATHVFSWLHQFRSEEGAYWTGYVYRDEAIWPEEKPTWTAGAVLLAADALSNKTPAAHLFRQTSSLESLQNPKRLHPTRLLKES